MAGFSQDFINEVRNSNDIVEVVSDYVKLKRSGRNYFGLCPFHNEKTPSFSVSQDKQIFHCFGCNEGGNVINFLGKVENLDFMETVKLLAERAKIPVPDDVGNSLTNQKAKNDIYAINTEAAKYFRDLLKIDKGKIARDYLKKREMNTNMIQKFGIGFSYGINDDLYYHLKKLGFDNEAIISSGLVVKKDNNSIVDRFKMRLMFPIFDVRGRVVAFGGRSLEDKLPKYLNSPETKVFNKSRTLYGMNFAKDSKEKTVIMVEGYMDTVSLYQKGMTNVVASLGTSLTEGQARLINNYFDNVAISYDSDSAGEMATLRGLDILTGVGLSVKVIRIEGAKDPDELVKKNGLQSFLNFVENAKDLSDYKIDLVKKDFDLNDNRQKIKFVTKVSEILSNMENDIEKDLYVKRISDETGIGAEPIYAEINKFIYKKDGKLKSVAKRDVINSIRSVDNNTVTSKFHNIERQIIALLSVNDKESINIIKLGISKEDLKDSNIKSIYQAIMDMYDKDKEVVPADIISVLEEDSKSLYSDILQKDIIESDNIKLANELVRNIKTEKLEQQKKDILKRMQQENLHIEEQERLDSELAKITVELKFMK